jgi:hypothetical protein
MFSRAEHWYLAKLILMILLVLDFVGAFDPHDVGLKELLDDVAVIVVEFTTQISTYKLVR